MKKFISPNWKVLRKLSSSLTQAWFYVWDQADACGVYVYDEDYLAVDLGEKISFEQLLQLPNVQDLGGGRILLLDYIEVNYVNLKPDYNPHKPAFRSLEKNNLKLNSSLNQALFKLEDEDEKEDEGKDEGEKEKAPAKKPIAEWMELFPFKSQEAIKAMEDYISHRKQLRVKPYTAIGLKQAMAEWDRWGEAVFIEAVYNSIKNNWQGIFLPHKNPQTNGNNNQRTNGRIEPAPHGADFGKFGA
jgi:hypothetical protein